MSRGSERNSHQKRALRGQLFGGRATRPCCFCRRVLTPGIATLEHVVALSAGGGWELPNLRLSCEPCNSERGSEDFAAYRARVRAAKSEMLRRVA